MELKDYQRRALDALRTFLDQAAIRDHSQAYAAACAVGEPGAYGTSYRPLAGLQGAPYCCLRLPTGGGKTLLAAHAIGIARDTYLARRFPVVLWLVTSTTIADQTLGALKKRTHPYRQALEASFGGEIHVYGIDERRQLRPQDMADAATVIVAPSSPFASTTSPIATSIAMTKSLNRISPRCRLVSISPGTRTGRAAASRSRVSPICLSCTIRW